MRAARWMQVPPWDLEQREITWRERASLAEQVEADVRAEQERKSARQMQRGSRKGMH